jgi:hypoxanthine phosphoribosyltransferase
VLIVDDITHTGRTLIELAGLVQLQQPRRVSTVALVNKTSRHAADAEPTYSGLEIGEEFIYGYGLDWDERYRDLPFIALANP